MDSREDTQKVKFAFSIYDFEGNGKIDAFYLGDILRALNLTPTLASIRQYGGTTTKGKIEFTMEEVLRIYSEAQSNNKSMQEAEIFDDFVECLKSFDKHQSGEMSSDQLSHVLQTYGEKLKPEEVEEIFTYCGNVNNGIICYVPFIQTILDGYKTEEIVPKSRAYSKATNIADVESINKEEKSKPLTSAPFSLKTTKIHTSTTSDKETKQAAIAEAEATLKPKYQMPLIAMKTQGLIGNIVDKKK